MDGGWILRALLAGPLSYERATRVAAMIGQGLAFVLILLGLLGYPDLILVAISILLAASAERSRGRSQVS
jgi:Zn-dependent protease